MLQVKEVRIQFLNLNSCDSLLKIKSYNTTTSTLRKYLEKCEGVSWSLVFYCNIQISQTDILLSAVPPRIFDTTLKLIREARVADETLIGKS